MMSVLLIQDILYTFKIFYHLIQKGKHFTTKFVLYWITRMWMHKTSCYSFCKQSSRQHNTCSCMFELNPVQKVKYMA